MKHTMGSALVLTALTVGGVVSAAAQDEPAERITPRATPAVETIMRMRDQLGLSDEQVAQLDAIRREAVELRSTEAFELAELRSQLAAGSIERSDLLAFLEERRGDDRVAAAERQERIESVLDEAQLGSVRQLRSRGRAYRYGRDGVRRGRRPGFRGSRSGFRGRRPGFRGRRPGVRGPRWGR